MPVLACIVLTEQYKQTLDNGKAKERFRDTGEEESEVDEEGEGFASEERCANYVGESCEAFPACLQDYFGV